MLTSTFIFLHGVGIVTERRWWREGVLTWQAFVAQPAVAGVSSDHKRLYDRALVLAQSDLQDGNLGGLASRIKKHEHWRFYEQCWPNILYLDIETTGFSPHDPAGVVTVVGLYRNGRTLTLVRDETLSAELLQAELDQCSLLVTFGGTTFDVPYLQAHFPQLRFPVPHFDLCLACHRLGLRGGLKRLEQTMGITRNAALAELDGSDAVRLWRQWRQGHQAALDTLVAYNTADTENLVPLAELVYKEMRARFGPESVENASSAITITNNARSAFSP